MRQKKEKPTKCLCHLETASKMSEQTLLVLENKIGQFHKSDLCRAPHYQLLLLNQTKKLKSHKFNIKELNHQTYRALLFYSLSWNPE